MKSCALQRQQLGERRLLRLLVVGDDEVLHQLAALAEEHVLGAAQPDALGAEAAGPGGVLGGVGVGAHLQAARAVGVLHQPRRPRDTRSSSSTSSPSK